MSEEQNRASTGRQSRKQAEDRVRPAANPSREQGQRAAEEMDIDFDSSYLKAPPARPGYTQRWVRVTVFGKDDPINMTRQFRKGWRPRKFETVPTDFGTPTEQHGRFAGCLVVEGSVLCERPIEIAKKHRAHLRDKNDKQTEAIDAELRNASVRNPAYGPIEKQHKSVPVRERPVVVADDGPDLDGDDGAGGDDGFQA